MSTQMLESPAVAGVNNAFRDFPPYRVSVDEYVTFRSQGFLIVRQLVDQQDVKELEKSPKAAPAPAAQQ